MRRKDLFEFVDWVSSIEKTIIDAVGTCYPRSWNEDHISYSWISEVRKASRFIQAPSASQPTSIAWDVFKADGKLEEANGDIAFLVKQSFPNGGELVGVAFLEAKRIYDSGRFEKLDWKQLNRQALNSSNHRLILYDTIDAKANWQWPTLGFWPLNFRHPFVEEWFHYAEKYSDYLHSRATVCLSQHALAYRIKTRELHRISVPLGYQICLRYLMGQDLDYNAKLVDEVVNGVAGGVDYLFVAHIVHGVEGEVSIQSVQYSRDHYLPLDEPHDHKRE